MTGLVALINPILFNLDHGTRINYSDVCRETRTRNNDTFVYPSNCTHQDLWTPEAFERNYLEREITGFQLLLSQTKMRSVFLVHYLRLECFYRLNYSKSEKLMSVICLKKAKTRLVFEHNYIAAFCSEKEYWPWHTSQPLA